MRRHVERHSSARCRPKKKSNQSDPGAYNRNAGRPGSGKTEKDHVAGHVRREDVPESQKADRVDNPCYGSHAEKEERGDRILCGSVGHCFILR
jgi:hypothetical protein